MSTGPGTGQGTPALGHALSLSATALRGGLPPLKEQAFSAMCIPVPVLLSLRALKSILSPLSLFFPFLTKHGCISFSRSSTYTLLRAVPCPLRHRQTGRPTHPPGQDVVQPNNRSLRCNRPLSASGANEPLSPPLEPYQTGPGISVRSISPKLRYHEPTPPLLSTPFLATKRWLEAPGP